MYCKKCKNRISIITAIAYSATDDIRCLSCGNIMALPKFFSFIYMLCEIGALIYFSIYSFSMLTAWPLVVVIVMSLLARAFLLPIFLVSKTYNKKKSWRLRGKASDESNASWGD